MSLLLTVLAAAWAEPLEVVVRERGNGDPIAGVEVIAGDQIRLTGTDGRTVLDVGAGSWSVNVRSIDHAPVTVEVQVPTTRELRISLARLPPPLEIVVESFRPTAHVSRHHLDAETAHETPGTLDDAVRLVQALPGVAVQREYSPTAGDLSLRASAPGENRYFLDGIELPYLYHFHQYASVFPTAQIDSLEMYPSTFGSAFGDAVGGIVDTTSRKDPPRATHGSIAANFLMAGGDVRTPLPGGWWLSAGGRRSYQDLAGERSAQYTLWPVFQDANLRLQHRDSGVFLLVASDSYTRAAGELDVLDPAEAAEVASFEFRQGFAALGAEHQWHGSVTGRLSAGLVGNWLHGSLSTGGLQSLNTSYLSSRLDLSRPSEDPLTWAGGWEVRAERTSLLVESAGDHGLAVAREAPALALGSDYDETSHRVRAAIYGEARVKVGRLRVYPGTRVGIDTSDLALWLEPRLSARWRIADQTELEVAGGRYRQSVETADLVVDASLPATQSWQAVVGVEQTVAGRLELGLELWRKWLQDVLVHPLGTPPLTRAEGDAAGIELISRYRIRDKVFAHAWLGLGTSTATEGGLTFPTEADQPVYGGVVASWDPSATVTVGLRYRYGAGLPYTPITGSVYDATDDTWIPTTGVTNSARYPGYHKLDASVGKTFVWTRWSLTVAGEVGWVPTSSSQLYPTWNYDYTEEGWVTGPVLLPQVSARARF